MLNQLTDYESIRQRSKITVSLSMLTSIDFSKLFDKIPRLFTGSRASEKQMPYKNE